MRELASRLSSPFGRPFANPYARSGFANFLGLPRLAVAVDPYPYMHPFLHSYIHSIHASLYRPVSASVATVAMRELEYNLQLF